MPRKYSKWPILSHPSKYVRWRKWFGRKSSRRSRRKSNASWNCDLKKLVDPSGPIAWKKKSFGQSSVKSSSTRKRKWFQNAYKKLSHLWVKTLRDKNHTLTAVSLGVSRSCQFCPEKLDNSRSYQFCPEIWLTVGVHFSPPPITLRAGFLDRFPFWGPPPEQLSWTGESNGGGTKVNTHGKSCFRLFPHTIHYLGHQKLKITICFVSNSPYITQFWLTLDR